MKLRYPLIAITLAAAGFATGVQFQETKIQQTCEADSGATILNGTPYLCLSQRQIDIMRSHGERGA